MNRREQERLDEQLSAYLDGQLPDPQRVRLEERLAQDAALRAELEALRHTVRLLGELPELAVPRNFILPRVTATAARAVGRARVRRPLLAPALTAATSLATLLFGIVLTGEIVLSGLGRFAMAPAPAGAEPTPMLAGTPAMDAGGEEQDVALAPRAEGATPTTSMADDRDGANDAEEHYSAPAPTPSAEPGVGGGAPISGTIEPTSEDWVGFAGEAAATPTPAEVGEEAAEPVAEEVLDQGRHESEAARIAPLWIWRAVEIGLGLGALALGGAAVWAWRARRR